MKQKICPICDGKLKGNYCPFCRKIVRNPVEWDVAYYLNERHPQWETGCDYHSESVEQKTGFYNPYQQQETADVYLKQDSGTESLDSQKKKGADSPRKAAKSSKSKKNTKSFHQNTDSPKKKGRRPIWKVVLTVAGIWMAAEIVLILVSYAVSELEWNPVPEPETRQEAERAEEIQWDIEFSEETTQTEIVLILVSYAVSELEWNPVPEPETRQEAERAEEIQWDIEFSEETTQTVEDGWSVDEISELSNAEVIEMGEPCNTHSHFPVAQEAFLEKLTGYLDEKELLISDTIQSSTNFIYPAYTEGEYLTSYDQYYTCYLRKAETEEINYKTGIYMNYDTVSGELHWVEIDMEDREEAFGAIRWAAETLAETEEINYKTGIYMNYDTVSGELHWVEIDMEDREEAFGAIRWAAETLGEMAGFPHPEETAQQIYEELQAEELGKEWRFFEVEEYSLSVSEDQGKTMVILELSEDFDSAN